VNVVTSMPRERRSADTYSAHFRFGTGTWPGGCDRAARPIGVGLRRALGPSRSETRLDSLFVGFFEQALQPVLERDPVAR
jgi:hypothetical protein